MRIRSGAETVFRISAEEKIRQACEAREESNRIRRTIALQREKQERTIEEQKNKLAEQERTITEQGLWLQEKDQKLQEKDQKIQEQNQEIARLMTLVKTGS